MTMNADSHWQRAVLLFEQRRIDMSIAELLEVLAQEPHHLFAICLQAHALAARGDVTAGLAAAERAVGLHPENAHAHATLAELKLQAGQPGAASVTIQRAIALDPNDPDHHSTLGRIRYIQGRWSAAVEAADAGLALDPQHVVCLNVRALALPHLGQPMAALRTSRQLLAQNPDDANAHVVAGFVKLSDGDARGASQHFLEALRLDPTIADARRGLRDALRQQNPWYRGVLGLVRWAPLRECVRRVLVVPFLVVFANKMPMSPGSTALLSTIAGGAVAITLLIVSALPLGNLLVLLHPVGRHTLRQRTAIATVLAAGVVATALAWWIVGQAHGSRTVDMNLAFWVVFVAALVAPLALSKLDAG